MSKDTVQLYRRARAALQSEQDALSKTLAKAQAAAADAEKRLSEIEAALGDVASAKPKRRGRKPGKAVAKRGRPAMKKAVKKRKATRKKVAKKAVTKTARKITKKAVNKIVTKKVKQTAKKTSGKAPKKPSLKDIALQLTKNKALTAGEILEAAKKAGHKTSGKNPINGLRVMLYNNVKKKVFKNKEGKFSPA
ncbi:MAG: hypothetical protein CMO75_02135 [Verrucomicrobiales bacterium]|nr:hypothetical protein [Verrucomicrobiales bacterium]